MTRSAARVVVPLALLAAVVGAVLLVRGWLDGDTKEMAARGHIAEIEREVRAYKVSKGDYPRDLDTLTQPQGDRAGPLEPLDLIDPWGRPYVYEPDNLNPATGTPRIYSRGADPDKPADFIANW
jgi:hypothetical protein